LSMGDNSYGQSGGIALGFGANAGIPGPALLSSTSHASSASNSIAQPVSQPRSTSSPMRSNYDVFASLTNSRSASSAATPTPMMQQQKQSVLPQKPVDPFAALVSPSPRAGSPAGLPPPSSANTLLDLSDTKPIVTRPTATDMARDDDWNFTSSLPDADSSLAAAHRILVQSSSLKIEFLASRQGLEQTIHIDGIFSNETIQSISGLHFQVAVEKVRPSALLIPLNSC
jgi:ADP-ribosylation factor-binding protein GGA